jgi:hypothetical protein
MIHNPLSLHGFRFYRYYWLLQDISHVPFLIMMSKKRIDALGISAIISLSIGVGFMP